MAVALWILQQLESAVVPKTVAATGTSAAHVYAAGRLGLASGVAQEPDGITESCSLKARNRAAGDIVGAGREAGREQRA